ncbi:protein of unknown function [Nitrosotalea devaniterrae]|uniref:Uncharacterized protein n=2 Tax=cellular organisms TaxID=131567 RepID=A0A128A568_9ARCH|nr:hypothetical protein IB75_17575 [Nitrosococcus oceani C-27]CUR52467.1 protein of unknown function [Candidatus Nitrosotalea devanaterra]
MSVIENQNTPSLGEMWQFINKNLSPIGMMPDKASLDYSQTFWLYRELRKLDNTFRDVVQVHVLKNELSYSLLETLVN